MEKRYQIGEVTYIQRQLVLGQIRQLFDQLEGVVIPTGGDVAGIISAVGDKMPLALAILLTPEGQKVKEKNLPEIADQLEFDIDIDTMTRVVEDFFECNPIASLLAKLRGAMTKVTGTLKPGTPSMNLSASSLQETLPKETESSGDSPQTNASPTSDIAPAN